MAHGTKYRDALLFSLTLHDVNTGRNKLKYYSNKFEYPKLHFSGNFTQQFRALENHCLVRTQNDSGFLHNFCDFTLFKFTVNNSIISNNGELILLHPLCMHLPIRCLFRNNHPWIAIHFLRQIKATRQ